MQIAHRKLCDSKFEKLFTSQLNVVFDEASCAVVIRIKSMIVVVNEPNGEITVIKSSSSFPSIMWCKRKIFAAHIHTHTHTQTLITVYTNGLHIKQTLIARLAARRICSKFYCSLLSALFSFSPSVCVIAFTLLLFFHLILFVLQYFAAFLFIYI